MNEKIRVGEGIKEGTEERRKLKTEEKFRSEEWKRGRKEGKFE